MTHDSTVDDRPENELTGSTVYVDGSADRKHVIYAHNIRSKLMRVQGIENYRVHLGKSKYLPKRIVLKRPKNLNDLKNEKNIL